MPRSSTNEAAIPNPALKTWGMLVGEWGTVGKHRLLPDTTVHGHATIAWLQGGAFLMMQSETEEEGFPSSIAIFGSDDTKEAYFMLSFDERGVSRKFDATLRDNVLKLWRNAPGFSQRFTGTLVDNGDTINAVWELSEDDSTWKRDLELTYTRVK